MDIHIGVKIGTKYSRICKGLIRTGKHLVGILLSTETGGIMDRKIEELKSEKEPSRQVL